MYTLFATPPQNDDPLQKREYAQYLMRHMGPIIHALMIMGLLGHIAVTITSAWSTPSSVPLTLRLAPLLPMLAMTLLARRTENPLWVSVLMLTYILLLETGMNLNGLGREQGLLWVMPGTLMTPVAVATIWPSRWAFNTAMALCVFGPLPILLLGDGNNAEILQYFVYMAIAVSVASVLRAFMTRTLFEQFRLERRLREQANTDGLTGLLLRNRFLELAQQSLDDMGVQRQPACILYLDADRFKQLNDDHGHAAGDTALVALADCLRAQTRESDLIGRIGGEEFALLLPGLNLDQAADRAEKLRLAMHQVVRPDGPLTVSIGVAEYRPPGESTGALLARADIAMRQAKQNGRDQVVTTVRAN